MPLIILYYHEFLTILSHYFCFVLVGWGNLLNLILLEMVFWTLITKEVGVHGVSN